MKPDFESARTRMVDLTLAGRDISDPLVLESFYRVPRERFVPEALAEFAYQDAPLPIESGQTISQPYIVALTAQALRLRGGERVLEVGTGSGYAAAILGRIAKEVYTIERVALLAKTAAERLERLGVTNVHVVCGDGSLGLPAHAPYDAIAVAAGGPKPPPALIAQLKIGGRMVIPIGATPSAQMLMRITRVSEHEIREEPLTEVRFVPLVGAEAWHESPQLRDESPIVRPAPTAPPSTAKLVREVAEPIDGIESVALDAMIDRIGDAQLVLIGEASTARASSTACARASRASSSRVVIFNSSPSKPTGPMPRASTTTCSAVRRDPRLNLRHLRDFQRGCGATTRCTISWTGCARSTLTIPSVASVFMGSTSTACSRRSPRCSPISTRSIRPRRRWRVIAMAP